MGAVKGAGAMGFEISFEGVVIVMLIAYILGLLTGISMTRRVL